MKGPVIYCDRCLNVFKGDHAMTLPMTLVSAKALGWHRGGVDHDVCPDCWAKGAR